MSPSGGDSFTNIYYRNEVLFDTGSSDTFLPSISRPSSCHGHARYDPSVSKTTFNLNKTFILEYEGGSSVSGEQYNHALSIATSLYYFTLLLDASLL